jgi:hypothetical protein
MIILRGSLFWTKRFFNPAAINGTIKGSARTPTAVAIMSAAAMASATAVAESSSFLPLIALTPSIQISSVLSDDLSSRILMG